MPLSRRHFILTSSAAVAAAPTYASAADRITIGVIGTGGRGTGLAQLFAGLPNVSVFYVCDVDEGRVNKAAAVVAKQTKGAPKAVGDFRRILDDKSVDAVVIATCNHWHAPAAILACAAGKHVYVEKPLSHNPREGELLVEAAKKHNRQVQMGNQRRSWPKIIEACEQVRDGLIGRAYLAQSFYTALRPATGTGTVGEPPAGLNYDLWQGPAPRRPFKTNYLPYTWHWFWHWGNGELGNNGVHMIDLCRWGLGVDYPIRATSAGGRYRFRDDQETPDTHAVAFDFADGKTITWEGWSCNELPVSNHPEVIFFGEKGSLAIRGNGYTVHDEKGKEIKKETGPGGDTSHAANFLAAVRGSESAHNPVLEAHRSTVLCHLGNIAYRTGRALKCDPADGKIVNDAEAMKLWSREYEKGWEPRV